MRYTFASVFIHSLIIISRSSIFFFIYHFHFSPSFFFFFFLMIRPPPRSPLFPSPPLSRPPPLASAPRTYPSHRCGWVRCAFTASAAEQASCPVVTISKSRRLSMPSANAPPTKIGRAHV